MFSIFGSITALVLASTICQALPDLHKQMSPEQLHSVFHVDTHDAVPHYELVQLFHHTSHGGLQRKRRSIGEQLAATVQQKPHHVKKDLSKNAYYSELKQQAAASGAGAGSGNQLLGGDISSIKSHNVSFSAFGRHTNLTLRATQGLFKGAPHELRMWSVGSEPNATHGLDLQEILDEQHDKHEIGEVFQDEQNMAAILMRRHMETGDLIMEGSIGHDLVIKPLPHELSPNKEQAHHIVYKREASATDDQLSDFAFMEPDDLLASEKLERLQRRQRRSRRSSGNSPDFEDLNDEDEGTLDTEADPAEPHTSESRLRHRRQAPYVIYPEVLVIVDYDGYRLHGGDNLQVKRYFISFWNGVDLRYRLLKGPRIRISIAGIIISRGRDATPYLERNRVGRDAIDSAAALTDMGKYLFRERRLPVYDIAVAITKYDMCRRRKGGRCTKGTAGFAYVGGACVVNKRLEKVNSVAIIEDTGGFSGIIVAAHEVGHLLGAVHDGSPPPSYLGGPGAQRCRWEDGYIMSDLRHTERGFRWSACTVQSFHHFLNGDTATCLHNAPHEDSALGRSLPGTLLSLDAQCRRDRGTYACFKDERVCAQLFCFDAQTGYCVAYRPAAEGSACGNGYHCLDGRCTPLPSNIIPDYGNNYRLVYNATTNSNNSGNNNGAKEQTSNSNSNNSEEGNKRQQLVDDENDDNVGIEINEAIERQKRKFHIQQQQPRHLTTLQQQQQEQQQQQQQLATPTTTTSTASAATTAAKATPTPTTSTTKSKTTSSIIDAYFKKFQALHLPTLDGAVTATTTSVSTSVSSSATKAGSTQQQQQQQQQQQKRQQQQQQQNFDGSPFLKLVNWKLFPF
ncbi:A disintegrin and metalloproteinase with thrombospondin motifs like isoform X7 [Drosophila montana]|uniref:A disintegrin and metalloproteinase with thrombospondin motifs like isoform X7 n=1 Tax=Drosophila montana TaxID=40370 RepID=UPI00313DECA1